LRRPSRTFDAGVKGLNPKLATSGTPRNPAMRHAELRTLSASLRWVLLMLIAAVVGWTLPARAGDTVEQCHGYARQAVAQHEDNVRNQCGFTGPAWSTFYDGHFGFCRSAKSSSVDREVKARTDALHRCKTICGGYHRAAKDHIRIAQQNGCLTADSFTPHDPIRLPGGPYRWGTGMGHFNFCMGGASGETLAAETKARADGAAKCTACRQYADAAANDARIVFDNGCATTFERDPPGRWTRDTEAHFRWCMSGPRWETINRERDARALGAVKCRACGDFIREASRQSDENKTKTCGNGGNYWGEATSFYIGAACLAQYDPRRWIVETLEQRARTLRECVPAEVRGFCNAYAAGALAQRSRMTGMHPVGQCTVDGPRWARHHFQHYDWCVAVWRDGRSYPFFPNAESKAREDILKTCRPRTPSSPPPPNGNPPPNEPGPAQSCSVSVTVTNKRCCQGDSPLGDCIDMTSNPPGALTTFGCGVDEDQALGAAKFKWGQEGGPLLDDDEDGDDIPCQGCCTYEKTVQHGCICGALGTRPYTGVPKNIPTRPVDVLKIEPRRPLDVFTPTVNKCFSNMIRNVAGRCACPGGTRWRGIRCERVAAMPIPPSTPNIDRVIIRPVPPVAETRRCRWPRPVGLWPRCCPSGTIYQGGVCRRPARPVVMPPPVIPRPPVVAPQPAPPIVHCPASRPVGRPPYCCPAGTRFLGGVCRRGAFPAPATPGGGRPVSCPASRPVGRPPYCCPAGTRYLGRVCRRDAPAQPLPAPRAPGAPPAGGQAGACPANRPVGRPPYCCPPGTAYLRGACRRQ
jgi:hypothetical protein